MVKRRPNFSQAEIEALEVQVSTRKKILGKFSNTITYEMKQKEWQKIADAINRIAPNKRTADEARKKWDNVKSTLKALLAVKYKKGLLTKTGGREPEVSLPSQREERMLSVIGMSSVAGIDGGFDSSNMEEVANTPMSLIHADDEDVS